MSKVTLSEYLRYENAGLLAVKLVGRKMSKRPVKYLFPRNEAFNRSHRKGKPQLNGKYHGQPKLIIDTPKGPKVIQYGIPYVRS